MEEELKEGLLIEDNNSSHKYRLIKYVGSGSFGDVWVAEDADTHKSVAIKFYVSLDPRGQKEFVSEYEIASGLHNDCLLEVQLLGMWRRRPFLVMKYCPRGSSAGLIGQLQPGEKDERVIWQFIHDVASGLACLHGQQPDPIVHQDIKPDNVLMDGDGRFIITDFGISKKIRSTMRRQSTRAMNAGAVSYMGPERFKSQPQLIMASDIWSLGVSIFELATGELPFAGQGGAMLNYGAELPVLPQGWSKDLNDVMRRCLAKEPWDRLKAQEIRQLAEVHLSGKVSSQQDKPKAQIGEGRSEEPDAHTARNVWWGIAACIAFCLLYMAACTDSYEYIRAKVYATGYDRDVEECRNLVEEGDAAHTESLLKAKDKLETIHNFERQYKPILPKRYNKHDELDMALTPKLKDAAEQWSTAAYSQWKKANDKQKAAEYYRLSLSLYYNSSVDETFRPLREELGNILIKDIQFANQGDGNYIGEFGDKLYSSTLKYLGAKVSLESLMVGSVPPSVEVYIKIIDPSGYVDRGPSSPKGYSFKDKINPTMSENYLDGWGTAEGGHYQPGTYKYEIWYKGKRIFQRSFTVYKG